MVQATWIFHFLLLWTGVKTAPNIIIDARDTRAINYRLPEIYKPTSYNIHLSIPEETFTNASDEFTGSSIIRFNVSEATSEIKLHASHDFLTIKRLLLDSVDIPSDNYSVDTTTDILTITSGLDLTGNVSYELQFEFSGRLSTTDMYGFYKSSYQDESNQIKYLATTQFEPYYARRSFPCFDEPAFKATFDISITHSSGLNVLGNTVGSFIVSEGSTTTKFETTPIMSTYLVAYVVSEFTCSPGEDIEEGVTYSVCSRKEAESSRQFAVDIGPKLLRSLSSFTAYNYSLSNIGKMDQVGIPDFAAGAMENWGLVTYRERLILWDEKESSTSARQNLATVVTHEFSHQWFGDLVTMNWWSETFLNEGFATYCEYFITHKVLPEWNLDKQFVVQVHQSVLQADSLESTQALQSPANTLAEISGKFGTVSYDKGGSILRMVEHIMGTENFIIGIQNYINKHEFSNTVPENLWESLNSLATENLPTDLNTIMENWITKPGYPLLTVRNAKQSIVVTQERFLLSGNDAISKWYVPVSYTMSHDENKFNSTLPNEWVEPIGILEIFYPDDAEWIILNSHDTGYYRVQYDESLWNNISDALTKDDFGGIAELSRAQLVDDAFNLARANKLQYSKVFHIARFLSNETAYTTWYSAFSGFNFLLGRVGRESILGHAIAGHVLELTDALYKTVDISRMTDEEHYYTLTSSLVLSNACNLGKEECKSLVLELFSNFTNTNEKPPKNLRSLVYCNGLRYSSNASDWNTLWNAYLTTQDAGQKTTILSALGCTKNESLLEEYLLKSITEDSGIRAQDAQSVFSAVYRDNSVGVNVAFEFLKKNYEAIAESYKSWNSLSSIIKGLARWFTTQEQVTELEDFIATGNLSDSFNIAAGAALEDSKASLAWLLQFEEDLNEYYGIGDATPIDNTTESSTATVSSDSDSTVPSSTLPPDDTNSTLPPDDTNSTLPPDDTNSTLPPDDTNSTLPPDDTNSTLPPDDTNSTPPPDDTNSTVTDSTTSPSDTDTTVTLPVTDTTIPPDANSTTTDTIPTDNNNTTAMNSTETPVTNSTVTLPPADTTLTLPVTNSTVPVPVTNSTVTAAPVTNATEVTTPDTEVTTLGASENIAALGLVVVSIVFSGFL